MSFVEIQVNSLKKKMGKTQALQGITVPFRGVRLHGVIGPEGAGKTTLFRHLAGLLTPNEGNIEFWDDKKPIPFAQIRPWVGYMPQQQSLYPDLSIDEHLNFFKALYSLSVSDFEQKRKKLLSITNLEPFVDRVAGKLSGGMYKKLGLMCSLLSSPKVLLLDEPTNGVDPISRREFWELLHQLEEEGILIIVATAYMDEAERCACVHLLNEGKVIGSGEPQALLKENHVRSFDEYFIRHAREMEHV